MPGHFTLPMMLAQVFLVWWHCLAGVLQERCSATDDPECGPVCCGISIGQGPVWTHYLGFLPTATTGGR